jgi:hypothetical protein
MKAITRILAALLCAVTLSSCATGHLAGWGFDAKSVYNEPEEPFVRAVLKPSCTVVLMPVALCWDAVTLPFQAIFGVWPYGSRHMTPEMAEGTNL